MLYEIDTHTTIEINWSAKSIFESFQQKPCLAISLASQKKVAKLGLFKGKDDCPEI